MKTAVVVDAACDLPSTYIRQHQLHVLPFALRLGGRVVNDTRDVNLTLAFHHRLATTQGLGVDAEPCSAHVITSLFLEQLVVEYDRALLLTLSQTHSRLFQHATEASFAILRGYREKRRQAGFNTPFHLMVLDSKTLFAGQAVLADAVNRLLQNGDLPFNELRRLTEAFRQYIHCYFLSDDLSYNRLQTSKKSEGNENNDHNEKTENGAGFLNYHLSSLFNIKPVHRLRDGKIEVAFRARGFDKALSDLLDQARRSIDEGLKNPVVVISYAGNLQEIKQKPSVIAFEQYAQKCGVQVLMSIMSMAGGINVGPGAVSLAYAVEQKQK